MQRILVALLLGLAAPVASQPVSPASPASLTWMKPDFPPAFIQGNLYAGQGYGDGQIDFLIAHLPEFRHETRTATASRFFYALEHEDGVCSVAIAKTPERQNFALFSQRSFWSMPNRLVTTGARLARFKPFIGQDGELDLALLRQNGQLTGVYAPGTSYGSAIDEFIRDPQRQTMLISQPHLRLPLAMLVNQRADFIFGYPMEVNYYKALDKVTTPLALIPVKSDVSHRDAYVSCSKGPIGQSAIEAIDRLLESQDQMRAFLEPLRRWYSEDEFIRALRAAGLQQ